MTTDTYPICQICSKSFRIITATHLKIHGHTFDSYRALFPGAILVDDVHKERLRKRNKARAGIKLSKETKDARENLEAIKNGYKIVRIQVEKNLGNFVGQMAQQGLFISQ
jgi:hypothetical protein